MSHNKKFPYYGFIIDIDLSPEGHFSVYRYLIQAVLAAIFLIVVIFFCKFIASLFWPEYNPYYIISELVFASIASSIFLVFGAPGIPTAHYKAVIVGQFIGIVCGCIGFFTIVFLKQLLFANNDALLMAIALAMFLSLLLMTVFDSEHPPAAGTSVGLTLLNPDVSQLYYFSFFVFFAALCLALIQRFCYKKDGLKAIIGIYNDELRILKKNGILTLKHLQNTDRATLEKIFKKKACFYNFSSWIEQSKDEQINRNTDNIWLLKDLF